MFIKHTPFLREYLLPTLFCGEPNPMFFSSNVLQYYVLGDMMALNRIDQY